jgi:hypothetical protein
MTVWSVLYLAVCGGSDKEPGIDDAGCQRLRAASINERGAQQHWGLIHHARHTTQFATPNAGVRARHD